MTEFSMETTNIPTTRKACILKSQMKKMLNSFWNIKGIVHFEFIPQGQRGGQAYHLEILKWLREAMLGKNA
jgi:hypothetical protein